jgi:hypothetical protein
VNIDTTQCTNTGGYTCRPGYTNGADGFGTDECVPDPDAEEADTVSGTMFVANCKPEDLAADLAAAEKYITEVLQIDLSNVIITAESRPDLGEGVCSLTVEIESNKLVGIDVVAALSALPAAVEAYGYVLLDLTSCEDNQENGDEDGVDCGGSCPDDCDVVIVDDDSTGPTDNNVVGNDDDEEFVAAAAAIMPATTMAVLLAFAAYIFA